MTRVQKNLLVLTENFEGTSIHKNYLNELEQDEFVSGLNSLAAAFKAMYMGMIKDPQMYAMKDAGDVKGFVKNTNFLLLLAQKGILKSNLLEVYGKTFAAVLKDAKVTKPEIYFKFIETLGFTVSGLDSKIEASEKITVEFPDNNNLLAALKAMADAVGAFSKINPNQGNYYFESLDQRIFENYPATEPKCTVEYAISKLQNESRNIAERFYGFIKPLAKCEIKGNPLQSGWTATFTLKSTKKVIMTLKLSLESCNIKLNLANIGKYTEFLNGFPVKMIEEIRDGGWGCGNCNPKCESAFEFDLEGKSYRKCRCGSFVFDNPGKNDSELLLGLLKKELEFA